MILLFLRLKSLRPILSSPEVLNLIAMEALEKEDSDKAALAWEALVGAIRVNIKDSIVASDQLALQHMFFN